MLKMLSLAGGMAGAVGLSQFPEFSQQYLQRLAGKVDALAQVTADFDASADKAGLSREEALASMAGTEFLGYRQEDMRRAFARFTQLSSDLTLLRETGPVERVLLPHRFADTELLEATWGDFKPAMPVTAAGVTTAGAGFVGGWLAIGAMLSLLFAPFRRRRYE
ncbi:hypothetical protein DEA8626_00522 [Defluviimonas aquaemixtae]|uniref:DUF2937 domain-containing protein n=1 Tax=Albidovulum aquaemixtae TaxID=1542388 RepID=A0A2R8B334_9RHOB|nr:hypothetical protein DEA8626_00522 [Defluviimonas aquaemixtae]